ncbi:histone acetyltransferase complex SAGA/ADA subunit ADA2 [Encephalitozoon intestinalis ATCC 50506]|uniref:Histone acetyltransferase complex SAGA/ADA subunit ADA2 n=1 Tax=Encephalitozoon intestinalis (strain ATCC 50506) TaxID=876142 RepID=E0S6H3_ENCIT|nr:histone acetyltransferase complex SAGA/ADA subunit ADA2 [Encephalitozoon intestinalis ATCC 50506]ADM11308.1 histone acetyltransferase complex SAGA/ADA subunit ADA2 [Encephalitozoon intestinalis ATCC 50506]UTX44994.1 SANT domain-containing protein [Encephalitozoon intestinalis]
MAISCSNELRKVSVLCDNCFIGMESLVYVKCSECGIDLCLLCFVNQIETSLHSKCHEYRIVSGMNTKIHGREWTLMEEILFVEGLGVCGIGNWPEISKYVGGKKDVESHFYKIFGFQRNTCKPLRMSKSVSNPYRGLIGSYMPFREDFDVEYMNDHEALIKDVNFEEGEGELKGRLVEAVLDSYIRIIMFRNRRKHITLDRNLVDMESLKTKNEKSGIGDTIKWITPYLTKQDFNVFFRGLYIEKKLYDLLKGYSRKENSTYEEEIGYIKNFCSERERKLCEAYGLSINVYLELRKEVISCLIKKKEFVKEDFDRLFGFLKETDELYSFFLENGWIRKEEEKD